MPEKLVTRTEFSRSIEDAERYRAIETLKEVGLLISTSELETFHGRVGHRDDTADWSIDPVFANGGNDSGNGNLNKRTTIYTSDKQTASEFAAARKKQLVNSSILNVFKDKVRNYTPEQRAEWLGRRKERLEWLDELNLSEKEKERYFDTEVMFEAHNLEEKLTKEDRLKVQGEVGEGFHAEVHEIIPADSDATVIDETFKVNDLNDEQKKRYREALKSLSISITEGSPLDWDDRGSIESFAESAKHLNKLKIGTADIDIIAKESGLDRRVALQLASALNAYRATYVDPKTLAATFLKSKLDIVEEKFTLGNEVVYGPINLEYVQRYFRKAHIVGVRQIVNSVTINRKISSVSFFDLDKITSSKGLELERRATSRKIGEMAAVLGGIDISSQKSERLVRLLNEDLHAAPQELVKAAKQVEGYATIFEGKIGNWEGYTLEEHTETVLRNFDENYADKLPVEFIAPMRLSILVHHLGKPLEAEMTEKHKMKENNVTQAADFLSKLGVDEGLICLIHAVIGDGERYAFMMDVRGEGQQAVEAIRGLAKKTLEKFGRKEVSDNLITGFIEMCRILQVCDGGAYTSMAITRKGEWRGRHRNAPSFNSSFAYPVGMGKRDLRLRNPGDNPAPKDLRPSFQKRLLS